MLSLLNLVSTVIQLYIYALFIFIIMGWLVQFNVINAQNRFVYLVMDFLYRVNHCCGRSETSCPTLVVLIFHRLSWSWA